MARLTKTVPVKVCIKRYYIMYVEVSIDSGNMDVHREAIKQIKEFGEDTLMLDPEMEIEDDDILGSDVDWDGVQYNDE